MLNMLEIAVNDAVSAVCPIDGISFGKLDDKKTWRIDYKKDATDEQKKMAFNVIENFVWDDAKQKEMIKQERNERYKNDLLMKKGHMDYKKEKPDATFSDYLDYLESI